MDALSLADGDTDLEAEELGEIDALGDEAGKVSQEKLSNQGCPVVGVLYPVR